MTDENVSTASKERYAAKSRVKLSLVICTKDRPDSLAETLETVWRQTRLPDELVIIDDGHLDEEGLAAEAQRRGVPFVYHNKSSQSGLVRSRRVAVAIASGDVILFLDDDVILDKNYIEAIMAVYESDSERQIGGCEGVLEGIRYNPLQMLLLRLFGMDAPKREGQILKNFIGVLVRNIKQQTDVQWLSGCNMSYRREAIAAVEIPSELEDCFLGEDRMISYQVGLRWRLVATPHARLVHKKVAVARNPAALGFEEIYNDHVYFRRFMPQDLSHRLAFAWLCVGYVVINLLRLDMKRVWGNVRGVWSVLSDENRRGAEANENRAGH